MGRMTRSSALFASLAAVVFVAVEGRAQSVGEARAEELFREARVLMESGNFERACKVLERTRRLHEGAGVLLNLADCYEKLGRTASAHAVFAEAEVAAGPGRFARPEVISEARRRLAALEPQLCRLAIRVTVPIDGLVVKVGGQRVPRRSWGTAIAVDPGVHTIEAEGPDVAPWTRKVRVREPGRTVHVDIPALVVAGAAPAEPPSSDAEPARQVARAPVSEPSYWTTQRSLGIALTVLGAGALAFSGAYAWSAKQQYDSARGEDGSARQSESAEAVRKAQIATGLFMAGAVSASAGAYLWIAAPSGTARSRTAAGAGAGALWLAGAF